LGSHEYRNNWCHAETERDGLAAECRGRKHLREELRKGSPGKKDRENHSLQNQLVLFLLVH